jgi:RHS repeat-associated protein
MIHRRVRAAALVSKFFSFLVLTSFACSTDALLIGSAHATTGAGHTQGTFAVSPSGAATYSIPIWAPPGPRGIQPHIALVYNSQVGNGPFGVGWSLAGLSSIYRCNHTYAQDGTPAPVALVTSDGYCMDGQRLRLTGGTYGTAGSTYQTEIANFINVTAYGAAGNGPSYFVAQDRNGVKYTYGDGGSSQVLATGSSTALSWQMNEVSDPAGNTMTITYTTAYGSSVPNTISWTPSTYGSTTSYNYTMTFSYGLNVRPRMKFVAGTQVTNSNLTESITIAYLGTTVKKYVLTYVQSPTTSREQLQTVQECADSAGSNCLLPTQIRYQNGGVGVTTSPITVATNAALVLGTYDVDGDGRPDLVYVDSSSNLYVAFGTSSGYGTPKSTGINVGPIVNNHLQDYPMVLLGDVHGSGKASLLLVVNGTWWEYAWNSTSQSFAGTNTNLVVNSSTETFAGLADTNGDGLLDLITGNSTNGTVTLYTRLNTTQQNGALSFSATRTTAYSNTGCSNTGCGSAEIISLQTYDSRPLDFNGDGRGDIVLQTVAFSCLTSCRPIGSDAIVLLSEGTTFTQAPTSLTSATGSFFSAFGDLNDDGCTDIVANNVVYYSGCDGTAPQQLTLGATVLGLADWDSDGRTDVLVSNGSDFGVYLSTGNGFSSLQTTSIPWSSGGTITANPTGDGLDGLIVQSGTTLSLYTHKSPGQPPDLLISAIDGYGNSVSPQYVSIVQSNYANYSAAGPPNGYKQYIVPLYVASQATFSDPSSSGTYSQAYSYVGAETNVQGRGFSNFIQVQAQDSRNSLWQTRCYEVAFPYTGLQSCDYLSFDHSQSPAQFVHDWSGTHADITFGSGNTERYFIYQSPQTLADYQVSWSPTAGNTPGPLIDTRVTTYAYDNFGNATSISTVVTDNDSNSPYIGKTWTTAIANVADVDGSNQNTDLADGCLSLLDQSVVTYSSSVPGSTSVTSTKNFTILDRAHCWYTETVTQPTTAYAVTEDFAYDSFGNVKSNTITGYGMTPRQTTASWTTTSVTTGQFPMSITDPSGATTQFNYNLSYGLISSVTDPNSSTQTPIVTSWQYTDGFGHKTQELRPDGTSTTWTYQNCAGTTGCLVGENGLVVGHTVYNNGGSYQSSGTDYLDSIDRELVSNQVLLSGSYSRNEVRYDSLGHVTQRALPCTWSALTTTCTYWINNAYDDLNRLTQTQRHISSTNNGTQTTTYGYSGRTTTVIDPYSNTRTIVNDVNGWLRRTMDPYSYAVTIAYDAAGNKTGVTDSSGNVLLQKVTYQYGIGAFLTAATDIDLGVWTFAYDALGEKTGWTDPKGQSFTATYDALSRPYTRSEPDNSGLTNGLFTQWTWGSSASSHNIGKLQSVCTGLGANPTNCTSSPGYSENETYDNLGRLYTRAINIPGQTNAFTYTQQYSSTTGLPSTLTFPISTNNCQVVVSYGFTNGILSSLTDASNLSQCQSTGTVFWLANATNPAGQVTQETLGNGIVSNRTYDAVTSWLSTAQSGVGGGAGVKNLGFLYDEMGNVTQRQDNNLGLTENIHYDNDYRFSYSQLNGTQNLSVTYDNTGNITSRSDIDSGGTWTYDPVHKHEVTAVGNSNDTYTYDANGNAITRPAYGSMIWSSYNYPVSISTAYGPGWPTAETVGFSYGPNHQRWQQTYSGNNTTETTDYIGPLLQFVSSGGVLDYRHYIRAGNEVVAVYSRKSTGVNTFTYTLSDHQSSVASLTNSSGAEVIGESFTPFGNRREATTWSGVPTTTELTTMAGYTREGYTSQTALGLWSGLNHLNGRVEDAWAGRFLSADPTIPDPANTQSYNRYSYVNNNPLTYIDPSGFDDGQCDIVYGSDCIDGGDNGGPGGSGGFDPSKDCPPDLPCVPVTASRLPPDLSPTPGTPTPGGPGSDQPGGGGHPSHPMRYLTQEEYVQCVNSAMSAGLNSANIPLVQNVNNIASALTAVEAFSQNLASTNPATLGKALGPMTLPTGFAPTAGQYRELGTQASNFLTNAEPYMRGTGLLLDGLGVVSTAYQGYEEGGVQGAAAGAGYSAADAGVGVLLMTYLTPVVGGALTIGFNQLGGSQTLANAASMTSAIQVCNSLAGFSTGP